MNVFVLCTGRCGSVSFIEACKNIANFSCGHETRAGFVGAERMAYPDNHIEADNRLSWYLGRLHFKYGGDAFYVHLKRDLEATANSYSNRKYVGIMNAFASGLIRQKTMNSNTRDPDNLARDIVETMNQNIAHFLIDKPNKMELHLESIKPGFEEFWSRIDATGDLAKALECLDRQSNTSHEFKDKHDNIGIYLRLRRTLKMAIRTFSIPNHAISFFDRY